MTAPGGWTAPGWEPVADVFGANFERRHEVGAAFSAYHRGEKVVDLYGGVADETTGAPWEEDTLVMVFSTTKGAASVVANLLAERGVLETDAPAARYWPELAANGKAGATVDHLLSHRSGLPWVDTSMTVDEAQVWENVIRALEAQSPQWEPGTAHGYHATTFGWLVGELVRRATGDTLGTVFRRDVAEPLGLDFWIGLPEAEERRVARLIPIMESITSGRVLSGEPPAGGDDGPEGAPDGGDSYLAALAERALEYLAPGGPLTKALAAPGGALVGDELLNSREVHAGEYAAFNGIGDARSIARMYSACIGDVVTERGDKVRLIGPDQLDDALTQRTEGPDRVLLGLDIQWGLGFMLEKGILGATGLGSGRGFGHFGMGGSAGWADPDAELAMSYVMNRMDIGTTGDRRAFSLMKACYEVLGRA